MLNLSLFSNRLNLHVQQYAPCVVRIALRQITFLNLGQLLSSCV